MRKISGSGSHVALAVALVASAAAHAQDAASAPAHAAPAMTPSAANPSDNVQEITVTAQRRSELQKNVPISITALSAQTLSQANITTTADLQRLAPGLTITQQTIFTQPSIRGISTDNVQPAAENPVAIYVDNVYMSSSLAANFDLPDVASVQVLKGPQGTLFGRNATGGAILITTLNPNLDDVSAKVKLAYGRYNEVTASSFVSVPLMKDVAAASLTAYYTRTDGWTHNTLNGKAEGRNDTLALRGKLRVDPWSGADFVLSGLYSQRYDAEAVHTLSLNGNNQFAGFIPPAALPILLATQPQTYSSNLPQYLRVRTYAISLKGDIDAGPGKISTTTSYTSNPFGLYSEGDYTALPASSGLNIYFINKASNKAFSQELLYTMNRVGILEATVGAFYYNKSAGWDDINYAGFVHIHTRDTTKSYAAFGEAALQLTDALKLTGGLRYTSETIIGRGITAVLLQPATFLGQKTFHSVTPRATLLYKLTPDANFYASYGKGFKSGGYNSSVGSTVPVSPENIDAYEAGIKYRRGPFSFNASGFYYNYKDLQVSTTVPNPTNPSLQSSILENAAAARIYGAEFELNARPTSELSLTLAGSWLHARYTSFPNATVNAPAPGGGNAATPTDVAGNTLPRAPDFSGSFRASYTKDTTAGRFELDGNVYYSSKTYYEPGNRVSQSAYATVGGQLNWSPNNNDNLKIGFYGRNLTNKYYFQSVQITSTTDLVRYSEPRTYGIQLQYKY